MRTNDYPKPPWILRGEAIIAAKRVAANVARSFVPADLDLFHVLPGSTLAILALIRYGAGSTLQYRELIVAPAIVRVGWRVGSWISHIHVDSEPSLRAGREIWGVPKQLAQFTWSQNQIETHDTPVRVQAEVSNARSVAMRVPVLGPIFGSRAGSWQWSVVSGSGRLSRARGSIRLHGDDLEALGFSSVTRVYRLENFGLTMKAPRAMIARDAVNF
jgi:hypothetical protein